MSCFWGDWKLQRIIREKLSKIYRKSNFLMRSNSKGSREAMSQLSRTWKIEMRNLRKSYKCSKSRQEMLRKTTKMKEWWGRVLTRNTEMRSSRSQMQRTHTFSTKSWSSSQSLMLILPGSTTSIKSRRLSLLTDSIRKSRKLTRKCSRKVVTNR